MAPGIRETEEGDTEINKKGRVDEPKQKLILSNVDKCLKLSKSQFL